MKTLNTDLFPETLLVSIKNGQALTTSLQIAEFSKKRHADVLRAIESKINQLPPAFAQRNFAFSKYIVKGGKNSNREGSMYEMTEEGFALSMMGFTGQPALIWQVAFIEAFMWQRAELARLTERFANALDQVRPNLRPIVEATEAGQARTVIGEKLGKSAGSVSYHRSQARRFGLLPTKQKE